MVCNTRLKEVYISKWSALMRVKHLSVGNIHALHTSVLNYKDITYNWVFWKLRNNNTIVSFTKTVHLNIHSPCIQPCFKCHMIAIMSINIWSGTANRSDINTLTFWFHWALCFQIYRHTNPSLISSNWPSRWWSLSLHLFLNTHYCRCILPLPRHYQPPSICLSKQKKIPLKICKTRWTS